MMLRKDLILVALMCAILTLMIVPLSQTIIDVLLTINISLAVVLLMVGIYLKHPSDFATFPSVILIGTAFRLALSIGTTRLILSEADAGQIIETFGEFVVAGSVAIGLVIFLIITVVQFLVVTKGAERVAEVGARFALDALPGKQMSIDADIRAGSLDQEEGSAKRKQLDRDSQFFGAMDGAMKFVKGDAIAGLIIIVINLIGGIAVGVSLHGYGFSQAVSVYSLLTIGDGLVAQIPALLMSLSAGVIVTRVANAENEDLGSDIIGELVSDPRVPAVAAVIVLGMGFIPGFPLFIFAGAAATLMTIWFLVRKVVQATVESADEVLLHEEDGEQPTAGAADAPAAATQAPGRTRSPRFKVVLSVDGSEGVAPGRLQTDIDRAFDRLAAVRGIRFAPARVECSAALAEGQFVVELDEVPIFTAIVPADSLLLAGDRETLDLIDCQPEEAARVRWISFTGWWVPAGFRAAVKALGLAVEPPEERIAQQVYRIYERNLGTLLSKAEFETFLEDARAVDGDAVEQLLQSVGQGPLLQVFRYLAEDGVPMRPLRLLLDSLCYWSQTNEGAGPLLLAECMRGSMKRQLCHSIAGPDKIMGVAMVDPELESMARQSVADAKRTGHIGTLDGLIFDNETTDAVVGHFRALTVVDGVDANQLAVVVSPDIRRRLRNFLSTNDIHLPVMAPHEISADVTTCPIEIVRLPENLAGRRADSRGRVQVDG